MMIFWGNLDIERQEETGQFSCPSCSSASQYSIGRTYRYFHICFIPLARGSIIDQAVYCTTCNVKHSIAVLAGRAQPVRSAFEAGQFDNGSASASLGNVVSLTPQAAVEIRRRRALVSYGSEVVVRITPNDKARNEYQVAFDFPLADGQDWIGMSEGVPIVVDRRDAPLLLGRTVDFRDGKFCDAS